MRPPTNDLGGSRNPCIARGCGDKIRQMRLCATWRAAFAIFLFLPAGALAEDKAPVAPPARSAAPAPASPDEINGIERPARRGDEAVRTVANAMLWPFRLVVDLVFLATGAAGALLENEQIVPRTRDFFFTRGGEIGVFPTVFLETGTRPNIGARLITSIDPYAATVRGGYGGPDENVFETRMRLSTSKPFPAVASLEGMHDRRTGLGFLGIGQLPESDPRNQFRNGPAIGVYRERRERVVAGLGIRPLPDVEVLLSSSLTLRYVDDPESSGGPLLSQAFLPESIGGAYHMTRIVYTELALRVDSRVSRNGVHTGLLAEGYQGLGQGILGDPTRFGRAGFRMAAFLPFVRRTTILSPKIVVDGIAPIEPTGVPFQELAGQPTFRGFANRRDYVSAVASLDYRWYLSRFVAARLFVDFAKVSPSVWALNLENVRWAGGFGFDLHTSTSEVGRVAIAGSAEGFHFLFAFGVPAGFGDRQHRD
ncbi:MAG TPA: hypothetical protein VK540_07660 [Polyangiaceae bacterium]|nr:hypothetical protein [Polyangiaceae bacterium]